MARVSYWPGVKFFEMDIDMDSYGPGGYGPEGLSFPLAESTDLIIRRYCRIEFIAGKPFIYPIKSMSEANASITFDR